MKKALTISGGGAFGAWGGGVIQGLYDLNKTDYDIVVGSSTGSLLAPLVSLKQMDRLKTAYTNVTQKDIFNVNPFTASGNINLWNAFKRIIYNMFLHMFTGKTAPSLGESLALRNTIQQFFLESDFNEIKKQNKDVIATVVNLTQEVAEFKSSLEINDYQDFIDWIWASACAPVFMSLVEKDGFQYVDGGTIEHIPIQEAIDRGATYIDVIVHRPAVMPNPNTVSKNVLDLFSNVADVMHRQISRDDIIIGSLSAVEDDVVLNVYYTPTQLADNSLLFDKDTMTNWWSMGYNGIMTKIYKPDTFVIKKS